MVKESTVWDVYNNEARKVDNELVKDWTASLNFLLVFAAIFAAVLTAFIIESKKMLEPDQTEILVDITIQYFNSLGNISKANITRPDFEATSEAISINCLLFASLGASLVAALASVAALQWVTDYDAVITRGGSSPEDRAKCRQFRHAGVIEWKMGEIIAALPLLLYSSVILFWTGAIQWMWTIHHIVGYVVAGGTAIAVLFYASTTILGALYVSSPFRTPLSRGLYQLSRWALSLLGRVLLWLPIEALPHGFTWILRKLSSLPFVTSDHEGLESWLYPHDPPRPSRSEITTKWIRTHLLINKTARHREDETAKQDPAFPQASLAWLAEQLPISVDSHNRLCLFVSGMLALPQEIPLSPRFLETPWLAILDFLSTRYLQKILDTSTSVKDCEGLDVLLNVIDCPNIHAEVLPGPNYQQDPGTPEYWLQYPGRSYHWYRPPVDLAPMTFILARDVPLPSPGSRHELEASFRLIRWRNSTEILNCTAAVDVWLDIFSDIQYYSSGFFESCLRLFHKLISEYHIYGMTGDDALRIPRMIVNHALSRIMTIGEAVALAQLFSSVLLRQALASRSADKETPIWHPLRYGSALERSSQEIQGIHHTITLLIARAAQSVPKDKRLHWARWIAMMLWIDSPKEPEYWRHLEADMAIGVDCGVSGLRYSESA